MGGRMSGGEQVLVAVNRYVETKRQQRIHVFASTEQKAADDVRKFTEIVDTITTAMGLPSDCIAVLMYVDESGEAG